MIEELLYSPIIDNLLVRIHFIIVMIRWTGLAPWEFEIPFPGSLKSTFLVQADMLEELLYKEGFPATAIHGDRTQPEREQVALHLPS